MPVLWHMLRHMPRHVIRHVLEHVSGQMLERHVPDRYMLDRHVREDVRQSVVRCG